MDNTIQFIKKLDILDDDRVVLACSYGPDSMCLLDILRNLNINVIVAHVNHKLREESDKEYIDLKKYCDDNNLIFEGTEIKEYPKGNIEALARDFRYNFFDKIVSKYNAKYLFTAHHGDDLVETILMRLLRGSSFKGYAGFNISTKMNGYVLCRPLIYVTKNEIMNYVNDNNIPYAIDKSNFDTNFTRNKIRNEVLPILKEINPKIHEKFMKFSYTIGEYNHYIENEVDNLYSELYLNNRLDINEFELLPYFIKKCLLRKILLEIYGKDINVLIDIHLDLVFNLTYSNKANSMINLPHNIIVSKYYNILEFNRYEDIISYNYEFNDYLEIDNFIIEKISKTDIIKSNYLIRLSSKDVELPLHIRTRNIGDKMLLKNGTKKVGEILSESKIYKKDRDRYPIVLDNKGIILWIPGIKKSKFDKQISEEYDIIIKCIKKEKDYEEKK